MKSSAILALTLLGLGAPALAEPVATPRSQAVRTADLDLSKQSDRTRLDHRIRVAVNSVCGEALSVDLVGQNEVQRCREETKLRVEARVNAAVAAAQPSTRVASAR